MACLFCGFNDDLVRDTKLSGFAYYCHRCGHIRLTEEAAGDFPGERFSENEKTKLSIYFRKRFEREGELKDELTFEDLKRIAKDVKLLDPIEKMDLALEVLSASSNHPGDYIDVDLERDYPKFYCSKYSDLRGVLQFLFEDGFLSHGTKTRIRRSFSDEKKFYVTSKAYKRLREIRSQRKDLRQCFVAMWFGEEVAQAYKKAIKPAIEYKEEGATESRFKAQRIDEREHSNDINDEIIAQIRRSRFMVCDLTGYRGGVYFEAGFAFGLGLPVIYTCRKDWIKPMELEYRDSKNQPVTVKQEGIHFDLEHRNRIEWENTEEGLQAFKKALTNRIKALIL